MKDDIIYHSDYRRHENNERIRIFELIMYHIGRIISLQVIHNGHGPKVDYTSIHWRKTYIL